MLSCCSSCPRIPVGCSAHVPVAKSPTFSAACEACATKGPRKTRSDSSRQMEIQMCPESAPPTQRHRPIERVRHGRSSLLRREIRRLQLKIPARLPVGVIDQHHARLRSEEHTSELQSRQYLVCRLLLEKKKKRRDIHVREP